MIINALVDGKRMNVSFKNTSSGAEWSSESYYVRAIGRNVKLLLTHTPDAKEFTWNGYVMVDGFAKGYRVYNSNDGNLFEGFMILASVLDDIRDFECAATLHEMMTVINN